MSTSIEDKGLMAVKMAIAATKNTAKLLAKYGRVTPKLPLTVPHSIWYGPGGTGKTMRAEQAAELMGCNDENARFVRVSPDCLKKDGIEGFIRILNEELNWDGYLCNQGNTCHKNCNHTNHTIVDPVNPRAPITPVVVFIDEIHVVPADIQEKLGLVILDFRYQTVTDKGLQNYFFPKFTLFAATTRPGDLIKPLRTRFANKVSVDYYTDSEMTDIAASMSKSRGWSVSTDALSLIAKASQGIARECENHINGLYNCWIYMLSTGQDTSKSVITKEVAMKYLDIKEFTEDGMSFDQVKVLKYLSSLVKDGKIKGAGINRICGCLGVDAQRFADELEPRLAFKGMIVSGGKGREITENGLLYLQDALQRYPDLNA